MQLRELTIRSVPFIRINESLTDRGEELRKNGLVQEFLDMVPSFRRLGASELIYKIRPKVDGLYLEFCVLESPQRVLQNLVSVNSKGAIHEDFEFRTDLKMLQDDLSRIPAHVQESISSGTDLLDLLDSGEHGAKLRIIRKSLRRGSKLHPLIQPELVGLDDHVLPHLMALGHEVFVEAQVHDIRKSFVRLKNFTFKGTVPEAILSVRFGKYIELLRPTFQIDGSINTLLLGALDTSEVLEFKAVAAFRWRDGYPVYFELMAVSQAPLKSVG